MAHLSTSKASPADSAGTYVSPATTTSMESPTKRRRLGNHAHASFADRKMDDLETSLEVDHMILDYLLYRAIDACLSHPHTSWDDHASPVELGLLQVDEFFSLFKNRYSKYKLDPEIHFRLELLQFVTLYTQRMTRNSTTPDKASLKRLRKANSIRAYRWIEDASRRPTAAFACDYLDSKLPFSPQELDHNRKLAMQALKVPTKNGACDDAFYGTNGAISLLDLLPLLMKVSAACFDLFNVETPLKPWMQMVIDVMLQACLEQYLTIGEHGSDAIDEAFAWGYKEKTEAGKEIEDEDAERVNSMFEDEQRSGEVLGWGDMKDKTLNELFAHGEDEFPSHLLELAERYPLSACESSVMSFLRDISDGIAKPILSQLELGRLDGLSEEETQSFIRHCGLDVKTFLAGNSFNNVEDGDGNT